MILRAYQFGDGEAYFQLLQSNFDHLSEEAGEVHKIKKIADAEKYVRERHVEWLSRKRFVLTMISKDDNKFMGQIWIEPSKWEYLIFEIGYFVEKKSEGKGFVTEAVKSSVEFMFKDLAEMNPPTDLELQN